MAIVSPAISLFSLATFAGCGTTMAIPDPAVRFVAFGDSTTAGPADLSYPDFLPELLDQPADAIANEGIGGEDTGEGLNRLQELLDLALYPNATTLLYWQGGNDISAFIKEHDPFILETPDDTNFPFTEALTALLDQVQTNVEAAITSARGAGLAVFVATYYPMVPGIGDCDPLPLDTLLPTQSQRANVYLDLLNDRLRQAAANTGATLIDVAAIGNELTGDSVNYFNCNHLSEIGNETAAGLFATAIQAAGS